ncbi:MAG: transposase [Armatimonadetes bacterium]|nr:transposase [Armatimonadota bacterium]
MTIAVEPRRPVFTCPRTVDLCVVELCRAARRGICAIPAYCFMPDHVHMFIQATHQDADAWLTIVEFKRTTSQRLSDGSEMVRWQPGCHVSVPDSAGGVDAVCAYVWNNPVRAGLVTDWRDYRFSGSLALGGVGGCEIH